jgi:hypothetical protein
MRTTEKPVKCNGSAPRWFLSVNGTSWLVNWMLPHGMYHAWERPRRRRYDNIKINMREIGWKGVDWIYMAQNRIQWWVLNTVIHLGKVKLKVRLSLCFNRAPLHEGVLEEWSDSRPGRFTPRERAVGTHWIGGWVGSRAGLDTVV